MNFPQPKDPQNTNVTVAGEPPRRVFTSHNQEMPTQLSYQSIKLANFIQLQLTDLCDSLQQINKQNFKNHIKQCLSRSYSAFHQMKKLYSDLGMNFLYLQSKKLISSYGVIFVYLLEQIQKLQKNTSQIKNNELITQKQQRNLFDIQVKRTIDNIIQRKTEKQTKNYKKFKGIHLFNQSYARCVDYDIELIRQLRQKQKQNQRSEEEKNLFKNEELKKFKKEVVDQLNDFSHLRVDGEQLHMFLNKHKKLNETGSKLSLQNQLQKIALFFKQSQHQALQFLRKQKNLQSFHELTEGFNVIVSDYQNNKTNQLFLVKDKIKQIFEYIKNKVTSLQVIITQKQLEIKSLKQAIKSNKNKGIDAFAQTFYNFDDEAKQLYRRIVVTQMVNQQLKNFLKKSNEQDRRQKDSLIQQLSSKQCTIRQIRQSLEQKTNYSAKIQKKLKLAIQNLRSKNITDPLAYFNSLSEQMKRYFIEQLKQQGFFTFRNQEKIQKLSSRHNRQSKNSELNSNCSDNGKKQNDRGQDLIEEFRTQNKNIFEMRKRESSFFKRSILNKQNDFKNAQILFSSKKSINLDHIPEIQPSTQLKNEKVQRNVKQIIFKSRKNLSVKPNSNDSTQQKKLVFQIKDLLSPHYQKNNNDKSIRDSKKPNYISRKNISSHKQQSGNITNDLISGNTAKTIIQQGKKYQQKKRTKHTKGIIKTMYKQERSFNKSIKIISNSQNFNQLSQNDQTESKSFKNMFSNQNASNSVLSKKQKSTSKDYVRQNIKNGGSLKSHKSICRTISRSSSKSKSPFRSKNLLNDQQDNQSVGVSLKSRKTQKSINAQQNELKIQIQNRQSSSFCNSRHKLSIHNEFNIVISNPQSKTKIVSQKSKGKPNGFSKNISDDRKNQIKTQFLKQNKQNQIMRTTARKDNKFSPSHQPSQSSIQNNRLTRTNMKINKDSLTKAAQSLNNTFYKQNKEQQPSQHRNATKNANRRLGDTTNMKQFTNSKGFNQQLFFDQQEGQSENFKKTKGRLKPHQQKEYGKRMLQNQFGDQQIELASRMAKSIQQFKNQVFRLHQQKCGNNCRHLSRYLQIFIKQQKSKTRRQTVKLHIQNMNEKLGQCLSDELVLPSIKK